MMAGKDISVY